MKKIAAIILTPVLLATNSCSLYQKPKEPTTQTPQHFKLSSANYHHPIPKNWWVNFNDNDLNQLIDAAFKKNYSYLMAVKNIEIARTYISQNESMRWPQLNLNSNLTRNHSISLFNNPSNFNGTNGSNSGLPNTDRIFNLAQLFASVSYELDVWNQIGNTVHQSVADTAANEANSKVVKLTLLNSVIDSYFQLATLNANLLNLQEQRHAAEKIVQLTTVQFHSGLIDGAGVDDAKNQLASIKSNLALLQKQKDTTQYTLAYLLGDYPEHFKLTKRSGIRSLPLRQLMPAALPSQMLTERPDIQQAFYQVMSAGYIEKQSYANFFPSFALTGSYGYANQTISSLLAYSNSFWNYGLNLVQPVFDYQLRSSEYKRAELQYENAVLNYKNVVINAFKEVDTALTAYQQDNQSLQMARRTTQNNHHKLALAHAQYRSGLTDDTAYLTTKLAYLQSQYQFNADQLVVIQDVLQVYKTLGVGLDNSALQS